MVLAILLVSATAAAEGRVDQARELHEQGEHLARHHQYLEAADRFIAAYNVSPEPAYLLEIARTYRTADACAKAAHYYRAYLSVTHLPIDGAVGQELAEVDTCAQTQPVEPVQAIVTAPAPAPASPSHAVPITITAVGLALVGGGGAFSVLAHDAEIERDNLCPAPCTWTHDKAVAAHEIDSRGNRDAVLGVVGIAAGVGAVAAGIALYVADSHADRPVVVAPAPGGASVIIRF